MSGVPFKQLWIGGKWDDLFLMPSPALKIWLYHYRCEGREREGWPSINKIASACNMSPTQVKIWRKWLVENEWLDKLRQIRNHEGEFMTKVCRVRHGTVDGKPSSKVGKPSTDGSAENRLGIGRKTVPRTEVRKTVQEVEPLKREVEPPVEPPKVSEEVKESVPSPTATGSAKSKSVTSLRSWEDREEAAAAQLAKELGDQAHATAFWEWGSFAPCRPEKLRFKSWTHALSVLRQDQGEGKSALDIFLSHNNQLCRICKKEKFTMGVVRPPDSADPPKDYMVGIDDGPRDAGGFQIEEG